MSEISDWTNGVVAIIAGDHQPVGTGFVVSADGLIVTCAHVLQQAGWPYGRWESPLTVRFKATGRSARAFVLEGCFRSKIEGDTAVLALDAALPEEAAVLPLAAARGIAKHEVSLWGYPPQRPQGLGGDGKVVALVPDDSGEKIQIESTNTTRGYSGGPVWDPAWERVVGMVLEALDPEADALGRHPYTTFAAPVESLVQLCPERLQLAPPVSPAAGDDSSVLLRRLHPYLRTLQRRTKDLPLTGLDQSGEKGSKLDLARVFVGLKVQGRIFDEGSPGDIKGTVASAIGHVHLERKLILLGDPGSGKSTLLRYIGNCLAGASLTPDDQSWREQLSWPVRRTGSRFRMGHWQGAAPVPIFVVLRDFARRAFDRDDGTAIVDYVCAQLELDDLADCRSPLRELARRGRVLFLLDGVDEVPSEERSAVWAAISALEKGAYGGNRWVATCRVLSFDQAEAPNGVPAQTLRPLDEEQINQFVDNWYAGLLESGQVEREQALTKSTALQAAVQRPALRELAQNPMLLTIMALVQTFRGTLPDDRAKLYQACVETLLLRWQLRLEQGAEGDIPDALRDLGTTQEDLERLLWAIAWEAHSKAQDRSRSADIPRWDVIAIAEAQLGTLARAEQFLAYTEQRAHLLVGRGGRREQVYSFPHRTFQEYLAACHLASQRRFARRARELAVKNDDWREVLNLAVGTLAFNQNNREKAFDAVAEMLPRRTPEAAENAGWRWVWLAGEMCATIGRQAAEKDEVGQEILPRLRQLLVALLENEALTPRQRAEAGDALGVLGDPRPGVCTLQPEMLPIAAGRFRYQDGTRTIAQPFAVARYPVTVAQFGRFMAAGGYAEPRYWGGERSAGWKWRLQDHPGNRGEGPVSQPRYWLLSPWHGANRPIVGVSWYEAMAYCAWLSQKSEREYRLPAEEEWERAARHTDGRQWAWGDDWQDGIINSSEAQINSTTAVGAFPRGAAECGAQDMSGNVWEWTASFYDDDKDSYVVWGGSWFSGQNYARASSRYNYSPSHSNNRLGFRVVSPVF